MAIIKTKIIVLSKLSYQESSLIISTISPDHGKLDFIVKGAKRISKKNMPIVDLFRELVVEFREKENTKLLSIMSMDMIADFDRIALTPAKLSAISGIMQFLLKNEHPGIACPLVYQSFRNMLCCCAEEKPFRPFLVKLVYLFENGLLPQDISETRETDSARILKFLIDYSTGKRVLPSLDQEYLDKLQDWVEYLCRQNELEI